MVSCFGRLRPQGLRSGVIVTAASTARVVCILSKFFEVLDGLSESTRLVKLARLQIRTQMILLFLQFESFSLSLVLVLLQLHLQILALDSRVIYVGTPGEALSRSTLRVMVDYSIFAAARLHLILCVNLQRLICSRFM